MTAPEPPRPSTGPSSANAADTERAPAPTVELEQPFAVGDLYTVRAAVSAHTDAAGLPQPTIDALLIIVGELTGNVLRHGGGAGRLTVWRTGSDIICQVSDHGPGITDPDNAGRTPVPITALGGRGLWIVRQLARHLDIVTTPHGTTITATIPLDQPAADTAD
ncbi:ATP-binding protein [Dactylosporangium vinaceum]|uniref:ATP-binding protein n=1 Tax=Dactylosporangium vinaceum TaxID=53362 RepID=A0ABV5MKX5_9ACTN|nr:ATP-binding protein [Dactylosporangium vinaceum]UAB93938.1 ATP-binding protein [Dactylosporangium vinaceum]